MNHRVFTYRQGNRQIGMFFRNFHETHACVNVLAIVQNQDHVRKGEKMITITATLAGLDLGFNCYVAIVF